MQPRLFWHCCKWCSVNLVRLLCYIVYDFHVASFLLTTILSFQPVRKFSTAVAHLCISFLLFLFLVPSFIWNEVKTHLDQWYLLSGLTLLSFRSIFISRKFSPPDTYPICNTVGFCIIFVYRWCVIYSVSASLCHHLYCVLESGALLESDVIVLLQCSHILLASVKTEVPKQ